MAAERCKFVDILVTCVTSLTRTKILGILSGFCCRLVLTRIVSLYFVFLHIHLLLYWTTHQVCLFLPRHNMESSASLACTPALKTPCCWYLSLLPLERKVDVNVITSDLGVERRSSARCPIRIRCKSGSWQQLRLSIFIMWIAAIRFAFLAENHLCHRQTPAYYNTEPRRSRL